MKIKFSLVCTDLIIIELLGVSIWLVFFPVCYWRGNGDLIGVNIYGFTQ